MLMLRQTLRDERGTTLIELMVGMAAGLVILFAISMVLMVSLRESHRVSARVDAVQRARITLSKVMEELHSACIAPQIAPVKEGTGTSLTFIHQTGSEVVPKPIRSTISLSEGKLLQSDTPSTGGTAPEWSWGSPSPSRVLMTGIGPTPPSANIFTYYTYVNGQLSAPLTTVDEQTGRRVTQVHVAFTTEPSTTPVADSNAPASIQDTATLRLTPPSFNPGAINLPCQ